MGASSQHNLPSRAEEPDDGHDYEVAEDGREEDGVEGERGRAAVLLLEGVKAERSSRGGRGVEVAVDGRRDGLLEGGVAGLEHRPGALEQAPRPAVQLGGALAELLGIWRRLVGLDEGDGSGRRGGLF